MITDTQEAAILDLLRSVASAEIMSRYRHLGECDVASKTSASDLVTIADKAAELRLTEGFQKILPGAAIVGEEAVSDDAAVLDLIGTSEMSVIIDPIDGTWNYARGLPLFGMIIAITFRGETVFGALYDPVMGDVTLAHKGKGAVHISRSGVCQTIRLAQSEKSELHALTGTLPLFLLKADEQAEMATKMPLFERVLSYRCSCHEYRILAEGALDFSLSGQLKPWDHAAGELIYREAGGYAAMLADGSAYRPTQTSGQLLLARSKTMWQKLRQEFAFLGAHEV